MRPAAGATAAVPGRAASSPTGDDVARDHTGRRPWMDDTDHTVRSGW